jgi:hypothetical protein
LLSGIDPRLALISVPTSLLSPTQLAMSIFLAGAGAPGPNQPGKDGNPKCPPEARVFALQVVDALLGDKSKVDGLPLEQKQAVEQAFLQFVETEYVEGTAEAGPGTCSPLPPGLVLVCFARCSKRSTRAGTRPGRL